MIDTFLSIRPPVCYECSFRGGDRTGKMGDGTHQPPAVSSLGWLLMHRPWQDLLGLNFTLGHFP